MYRCLNLLGVGLITLAAISAIDKQKVLAIGCDTYYRVTGQIAGCTDISTEKAQEAWLEKYSVCIEQQLLEAITVYQGKLKTYYARWESESESDLDLDFDRFSFPDLDSLSRSISSTTYRGNADFCDR